MGHDLAVVVVHALDVGAQANRAEIFHQLLEHRWYMSEREGREFSLDEVIPSYVEEVLAGLPEPEVTTSPLAVSE